MVLLSNSNTHCEVIPAQDCPKTFTINTSALCRYEKKGQLHAWVAFLITIFRPGP